MWRRSPAVPAAVAVLAVWSSANLPHLLTALDAAPVTQAASVKISLGSLTSDTLRATRAPGSVSAAVDGGPDAATASSPARLAAADRRVSRQRRTVPLTGALAGAAAKVPAAALVKPAAGVAGSHWVRPSAGGESSCFCMRWGVMHDGIDLAGPLGSPIVAVGDGVVVEAGPAAGFGLWVVIRHANGDYSIYGHMYQYYVTVGQHVRAGQHIADIGANGQSTGPHLHFGVSHSSPTGPYIDPVPWLEARGVDVGPYNPDA
jgi:murein DD-endopeptidase MepM/ murein hydrolase activator NlpD